MKPEGTQQTSLKWVSDCGILYQFLPSDFRVALSQLSPSISHPIPQYNSKGQLKPQHQDLHALLFKDRIHEQLTARLFLALNCDTFCALLRSVHLPRLQTWHLAGDTVQSEHIFNTQLWTLKEAPGVQLRCRTFTLSGVSWVPLYNTIKCQDST